MHSVQKARPGNAQEEEEAGNCRRHAATRRGPGGHSRAISARPATLPRLLEPSFAMLSRLAPRAASVWSAPARLLSGKEIKFGVEVRASMALVCVAEPRGGISWQPLPG